MILQILKLVLLIVIYPILIIRLEHPYLSSIVLLYGIHHIIRTLKQIWSLMFNKTDD